MGTGVAQAQAEGFIISGFARLALALVGDQDDGGLLAAHEVGEMAIHGGYPGARVHHQQCHVGIGHGDVGLDAHAGLHRGARGFFQTGGVDNGEFQAQKIGVARATVAGYPGLVVNDGKALAHQPVEQGGLADIGASDDGDGKVL